MRARPWAVWKWVVGGVLALSTTSRANAELIYRVDLDTRSLLNAPPPSGNYAIVFSLVNGDGSRDTTVTLSEFTFGSGGSLGSPSRIGGVSGDLSSVILLTDTTFYNEFVQSFTPGSALSFLMSLETTNPGLALDSFSFSILDGAGVPIPTVEPLVGQSLLFVELPSPDGRMPAEVHTYGSDPMLTPLRIAAPTLRIPTAVPEPPSLIGGLLGVGFLVLGMFRRRAS